MLQSYQKQVLFPEERKQLYSNLPAQRTTGAGIEVMGSQFLANFGRT
jgi:hypothetical protein